MWPATPSTVMPRLIVRVHDVVSAGHDARLPQRMCSRSLVPPGRAEPLLDVDDRGLAVAQRAVAVVGPAGQLHRRRQQERVQRGEVGARRASSRSWVADWSGAAPVSRL